MLLKRRKDKDERVGTIIFFKKYDKLHKIRNSLNEKNGLIINTTTCVRHAYSVYNSGHVKWSL